MKVHKEELKIILSQKTRLWFRAAVCFWACVALTGPWMVYSLIFTSQTTHFTCDRGAGTCAVDGRAKDVPPLADIVRAQMDRDYNRRDGTNWGIDLVTRDRKKISIHQQRAIKSSVVDDYRATVRAINAYLADPTRQKLDTSFTYRASLWEMFTSVFYMFFGVAILFAGWLMWSKRTYTFEPGKVTLVERRPFNRVKQEIIADRITAFTHRQVANRRLVELHLDDDSTFPIARTWSNETAAADQLAKELAALLGKRVESAPA